MRLGVIVSDFRNMDQMLSRLTADKLGLIFVSSGVYHAATKEGGKKSSLLEKSKDLYVLTEDAQTRGLAGTDIDSSVKPISYSDLVDVILNDFDKTIWI
jgi:sulfur relay protein TusB/DsrH